MIPVSHAQHLIDQHTPPLPSETVPLAQAHGRILRQAIASSEDLPPFDRSAMDGYALRRDDPATDFALVGEIRAGQSIDRTLQPGEAMRIFTGARLPGPGLTVVMQEHTEVHGSRLRILQRVPASHVRRQGEDARAGEVLLESGLALDATALALVASLGQVALQVSRPPRLLHLTTGDEIVPPEQTPRPGRIRNSNATLIAALCREQGLPAVTHQHAGDNWDALLDVLTQAQAETYDLVLISGGSGGGDYDFTADLFQHLGATIHFRAVNVRPGKPLIFGTTASQVIFGLPGNALSHFVCFHLFVRRALDRLLARPSLPPLQAFLVETMPETSNSRETWWPARASLNEGRLEARALPWKSSGDITRLPYANALLHVPASTSHLPVGTRVNLLSTRNTALNPS
jgi:molybdopterin molybdotransferase